MKRLPYPLRIVKHYANARATDRNWHKIVLGLFRKHILPPGVEPPDGPVFGVTSREHLESILSGFRETLCRLIDLKGLTRSEAADFCEEIAGKARLALQSVTIDSRSGLLTPVWRTGDDSFTEMLYAFLLMALQEVPYRHLHRCDYCEKFFLDGSRRYLKFCSARCRNGELVRRYRARHPEEYRTYQRDLMRRLYRERRRKKAGRQE